MRKTLPIWLALLMWSLTVGNGRAFSQEREAVKIGVCISLTGEFGSYGPGNLAGMRMFVEDYNSQPGSNRVHMDLVVRDDESKPENAVRIMEEFWRDGIQVVAGAVTSNIMLAMLEPAKEHGIVLISPGATSPKISPADLWGFKILPGDDYQGGALARFFSKQMGVKLAAAAVNEFYEYGEHIFQAFKREFERNGGKMVVEERYKWDLDQAERFDFSDIVLRLEQAKPEMLLIPGYTEEAVQLIRQTEGMNWNVIFCGGDSWLNHKVLFTAGPRLDDSYYIGGAEAYASTPQARHFTELLDASKDPDAEVYSMDGYDVMLIISGALESGARSALQIRDWINRKREFALASGKMTYDRVQGTSKTMYIYRIRKMDEGFFTEMVAEMEPE